MLRRSANWNGLLPAGGVVLIVLIGGRASEPRRAERKPADARFTDTGLIEPVRPAYEAALLADGKTCLARGLEGSLLTASVDGLPWTLQGWPRGPILRLVQSSAGDALAMADRDDGVWLGYPDKCPPVLLGRLESGLRSIAFSRDGSLLAAGGIDGEVYVFAPGQSQTWRFQSGSTISCLCFSSHAEHIAVRHWDGTVSFWDFRAPAGLELKSFQFGDYGHGGLACSPAATLIAWSGEADLSESLQVRDYETGELIWSDQPGPDLSRLPNTSPLDFSPDGTLLAVGRSSSLLVFDARTGRERTVLRAHEKRVTSVAFVEEGRSILTCGLDGGVALWDATELRCRWKLPVSLIADPR